MSATLQAPQGAVIADVDHAAVAVDPHQNLQAFDLDDLAVYTREGGFADGDSEDFRVFQVGTDDVHGVLKHVITRVTRSLKLNMFGYDDDELNALIEALIGDQHVFVQGTLDRSQAGGVHEKKILAEWTPETRASFAVGTSATHQISHTKGLVADGIVGIEGSTNWSASGEGTGIGLHGAANIAGFKAQNNTLAVFVNPVEIQRFSTILDEQHATALHQQIEREVRGSRAAGSRS